MTQKDLIRNLVMDLSEKDTITLQDVVEELTMLNPQATALVQDELKKKQAAEMKARKKAASKKEFLDTAKWNYETGIQISGEKYNTFTTDSFEDALNVCLRKHYNYIFRKTLKNNKEYTEYYNINSKVWETKIN